MCRKSIMHTMIVQGNTLLFSYRELLGRQQLVLDYGVGEAGLRRLAQQEEVAILCAHLKGKCQKANDALCV